MNQQHQPGELRREELLRRWRTLQLGLLSDYDLAAESQYVLREIAWVLKQLDQARDEQPMEGLDWYMHGLLTDAVLLRIEIRRRSDLGMPIGREGKALGDFAQELKQRVDLPLFLAEFYQSLHLRRSGDHMVAICPFHAERSPSLHVYATHYHCFGCNAHGDVYDWLMRMPGEELPFREAVRMVAAYCGVQMPSPKPPMDRAHVKLMQGALL